ncbi:MAG: rhomboid family intramembrane serine protease [Candidatus Aminicenantes bacterium]
MFIPLKDENPTYRFPYVTVLLITLNCVLFLYQVFSPEGINGLVYRVGIIPSEITHFTSLSAFRISPPLTLFASMFLHGSLLHLGGNMLYLWIFGNNVEDYLS